MKDRAHMTSSGSNNRTLPPSSPHHHPPHHNNHHHDHRHNRKPLGGGEESWHTMPTRGAEINLLANSLSTRLRKTSSRNRTASSSTPGTALTSSSGSRSAPPEESVRKLSRSGSKRDSQSQMPQSILKRTLSKETAEQQYRRHLLEQRPGNLSPRGGDGEAFHLPDVFMTRRWSSSAGHLDRLGEDAEVFNNQYLDRPSPAAAIFTGGGGGGGGSRAVNGHVAWVKRAGIFQPVDKYASGRQSLHGDDQPFGRVQPVDYETVTLSSRAGTDSPDSDVTSGGWSSGKSSRRKGLKVSWKQPGDGSEGEHQQEVDVSRRQRSSAGTVHSEQPVVYKFVKPKFNPGRSQVAAVGVMWKVPTPGKSPPGTEGTRTPENVSGHCSPVTSTSATTHTNPPSYSSQRVISSSRSSPPSASQHPWPRALHPRDVHPVTTAMEREGTSVSRTKWQVPSVRPVPAYTFIEDLLEANGRQWHSPGMQPNRLATRVTVDAQSMQNRLQEGVGSVSSKDPAASAAATISNVSTDQDLEASSRS